MRNHHRRNAVGSERNGAKQPEQLTSGGIPKVSSSSDIHLALIDGFIENFPVMPPLDAFNNALSKVVPLLSNFLNNFDAKKASQEEHKFLKELYSNISFKTYEKFGLLTDQSFTPIRLARIIRASIDEKEMPRTTTFRDRAAIRRDTINSLSIVLGNSSAQEFSKKYHKDFKLHLDKAASSKCILGSENLKLWDNALKATYPIAAIRYMRNESERLLLQKRNTSLQAPIKERQFAELNQIAQQFCLSLDSEYSLNSDRNIHLALIDTGINFSLSLAYLSLNYKHSSESELIKFKTYKQDLKGQQLSPRLFADLLNASKENESFTILIDSLLEKYIALGADPGFTDELWHFLHPADGEAQATLYAKVKLAVDLCLSHPIINTNHTNKEEYLSFAQELLGQLYDSGEKQLAQRLFNKTESSNY